MTSELVGSVALFVVVLSSPGPSRAAHADTPTANPDTGAARTDGASDGTAPPETEAPRAEAQPASIRITGTSILPKNVALAAVGPLPKPGKGVRVWGHEAAQRIVQAYRVRGYLYARAWFSDSKQPGVLWFDVDEGRMRVSFVGMGTISATLFRLRLDLPGGVFQKDKVENSLAEQRKAFNLANVYYRVHEIESSEVTVFGEVVAARTLEIHVVRGESFGWAVDISVSAAWGVVPSLKYSASDLLWHDDRLQVDLDMAFPYRRYVFDAAPRITWVHGGLDASYRLPHFSGMRSVDFLGFAPRIDSAIYFSQYARSDLRLSSFYLLRDATVANLVSSWREVEVSLGVGADFAHVFFLHTAATQPGDPPVTPPADVFSVRSLMRATAKWASALPWFRRDRRTFTNLLVDVALPAEVRANLWGQYLTVRGRHRLFLRGRAIALAGNVPFWDDVELAGSYQRVFFNDLYWAHDAAQVEVAYHIQLWRNWFELGVFHDLSVFEDRISSPPRLRAMDAFGPSVHFLILDQYALNIHQGIGFAPGKLGQTLSFSMESVF
jgi:hypothetical protein